MSRARRTLLFAASGLALLLCGCVRTGGVEQRAPGEALGGPFHESPERLVRCTLLIPTRQADGAAAPAALMTDLEGEIYARFGGFTDAGPVRGAYRMKDGSRAEDEARQLWIAVAAARLPELRSLAKRIGRELGQETIYLEVAGAVELVATRP